MAIPVMAIGVKESIEVHFYASSWSSGSHEIEKCDGGIS